MKDITGKKIVIAGMVMEIVAEDNDRYEMSNITTKETIFMDKRVLENAIKLGKAEEVTG